MLRATGKHTWNFRESSVQSLNAANFEYDVAFSFAGQDRELARIIASIAQANGLRVFIDEQHYWEAWGKNLNEYLGGIYDQKAKYVVILVSRAYCEKAYTNLERRRALDHALESPTEYILPVLLDESWLDGLPRSTSFLDARQLSATNIGTALVLKVKGPSAVVTMPPGISEPKIVPAGPVDSTSRVGASGLDFIEIRIAAECQGWKLKQDAMENAELVFRGGEGEDPVFDVVIMNRSAEPVLLLAVGIEVVAASFLSHDLMGGVASIVNLHRTYQLDLPDVWAALARSVRDGKRIYETSSCQLPDPVLIEARRPYRFGLHLFDYNNCCPTEVDLHFTGRTDRGKAVSLLVGLRYNVGGDRPYVDRYHRLLDPGSAEDRAQRILQRRLDSLFSEERCAVDDQLQLTAHQLWEQAGKPVDRDLEFQMAAKKKVAARLLEREELLAATRRALLDGEEPKRLWSFWSRI